MIYLQEGKNKFGAEYRNNVHQEHFEDLVLEGPAGLDELEDKVDNLVKGLDGGDPNLNLTVKIDGSPAALIGHGIEGYPDHFVGIKSVLSNPENAYGSVEEIKEKYPEADRAEFREMLGYCLELAAMMPKGEVWQGDCLFVQSTLDEETIDDVDCITFQPNKILYAVDKNSETGKAIQKAKFGIAFHTKYIRSGDSWKQSFSMADAADKLRANGAGDDFFFMGVQLHANDNQNSKDNDEARAKAITLADKLDTEVKKLREDPMYEEMCANDDFIKVSFRTFENANTSDKKSATINEDTFFSDIESYLKQKMGAAFDKKYASLKTEKGKEKAKANYEKSLVDLKDYIDNHKDTLSQIVKTLNLAAQLKMVFWDVFKNFTNSDAKTYLRSRTRGIVPAANEGIAVSDDDGNIVKIVDKTNFSSANRDPDYMSGFEHTNNKDKPKTERRAHGRLGNILRMHETQRRRWSWLTEASHALREDYLKVHDSKNHEKYIDKLISKIVNKEPIKLYKKDEYVKILDELDGIKSNNNDATKGKLLTNMLNELFSDWSERKNGINGKQFTDRFNGIFNDPALKTNKLFKFTISKIDKAPFSGVSSAGNKGNMFEAMLAYSISNRNSEKAYLKHTVDAIDEMLDGNLDMLNAKQVGAKNSKRPLLVRSANEVLVARDENGTASPTQDIRDVVSDVDVDVGSDGTPDNNKKLYISCKYGGTVDIVGTGVKSFMPNTEIDSGEYSKEASDLLDFFNIDQSVFSAVFSQKFRDENPEIATLVGNVEDLSNEAGFNEFKTRLTNLIKSAFGHGYIFVHGYESGKVEIIDFREESTVESVFNEGNLRSAILHYGGMRGEAKSVLMVCKYGEVEVKVLFRDKNAKDGYPSHMTMPYSGFPESIITEVKEDAGFQKHLLEFGDNPPPENEIPPANSNDTAAPNTLDN